MNTRTLDKSEMRILRNKINRARQLRRRVALFILSVLTFTFILLIATSTSSSAENLNSQTLYKYYKSIQIQPGDTLDEIADQYVSDGKNSKKKLIKEIMFINNMEDETHLLSGAYIIVPYYDVYHN